MEVVRDLLDKQVLDRKETKIGKVDGIVMELGSGDRPRITFIEIGAVALARRLGPRIGHFTSRVWGQLGGENSRKPYRIPWRKVRKIGVEIKIDIDVEDTTIFSWQDWLRNKVILRIPGA